MSDASSNLLPIATVISLLEPTLTALNQGDQATALRLLSASAPTVASGEPSSIPPSVNVPVDASALSRRAPPDPSLVTPAGGLLRSAPNVVTALTMMSTIPF